MYVTPAGGRIFLSGDGNHQAVGICISATLGKLLRDYTFHAYRNRVCTLNFTLSRKNILCVQLLFPNHGGCGGNVAILMLASGWRMGKLMSLFNILGLTVCEREMSEARFWPGGYVSKVYTFSTGMKLWTNMTLGLVDEALMELWYKLILSLEIHGPFSIKVGATTTFPLEMITVQCIAFWDSVSRKF